MNNLFAFSIPADTPFSQLKLSEVGSWFGRRNKSPQAVAALCSRAFWRWQHKYCQTKRVGVAPFFQFVAVSMVFFYTINYNRLSKCPLQLRTKKIPFQFNQCH